MSHNWLGLQAQSTLRHKIWCRGVGLHSGLPVTVSIHPADSDTGIVFHIMDDAQIVAIIPATVDYALSGFHRTVLGNGCYTINTIEHLMAALASRNINNAIIKVWGNELPAHDGSAAGWCFLLDCAGIVKQNNDLRAIKVLDAVQVSDGKDWCMIEPDECFSLCYELEYSHPLIGRQQYNITLDQREFDQQLAGARTFGFFRDADLLRSCGLALGATLQNTIVFDNNALLSSNTVLHWHNEPCRHKILDAIGDLALIGSPIVGKFTGVRSGHTLNQQLVRQLLIETDKWCWTTVF